MKRRREPASCILWEEALKRDVRTFGWVGLDRKMHPVPTPWSEVPGYTLKHEWM